MKYHYKTKPMKHQVQALKKFLRMGSGALFAEMGTGKTKVAIDWASALSVKEGRPLKAVVLCPKSVMTVWPDELEKHDPYHDKPGQGVEWAIDCIDSAWRPLHFDEIIMWQPDVLVIDESDMIKSNNASRSKGAYLIAKRCKYKLIMSGTPMGGNLLDLFSQFKVVDTGIFGTVFGAFRNEYVLMKQHKVIKFLRKKQLNRKIKPYTFSILREQCLDLPERTGHAWDEKLGPNIVRVPLSKRSYKIYDELAAESIVEFQDLEVITPIVLTRMLRLSQIASGWLSQDGVDRQIGQEKKMQLQNQLDEMLRCDVKKVVIFCRFRHELRDAALASKQAGYKTLLLHGGVTENNRVRIIKAFRKTQHPVVFIAQWQAGSRGIDLTCAHECICYGLTYSLIQYAQGIDRQHRYGQTSQVNYHHYVAQDTIDETVMTGLIEKKKLSREILEDPSLLYGSRDGRE